MNIAEGSIRSGKTTDNIFCFAYDLKKSKDKLHLATASTQPTAKIIIGDCDGYGLEHIFRGQCKWGKYKGNDCLRICGKDTNYHEKIVLFCGGAKADSYKKFRGMSIGLWIATEINLHHADTIREAQRRQINANIKRFYWDLNPDSPNAEIYKEFIDVYQRKSESGVLKGGFNLITFNIFDNINLSKENLDSEISKYEPGTVWYRRDILGERCVAEGIVFPAFANDPQKWMVDKKDLPSSFRSCEVGFDIGGNNSAYAITASALGSDGIYYVLRSVKKQAQDLPMADVEQFAFDFLDYVQAEYKLNPQNVHTDHNDVIINTLNEKRYLFGKTYKPALDERPFAISMLLAQGKIKFVKGECDDLIDELQNLVYDDKSEKTIVLDNGTMQIDTWDSFIYSLTGEWKYLMEVID
ncbi:MAG: PBSX family phage terminase large subunit [Clostridia bacterium]|nr:PBSX family phage terminase large subunit [Clostridia bacterium]